MFIVILPFWLLITVITSAHFPTDLLRHDKVLSKKAPATHLRDVPEYLLDPTTKEASKIVKLARAAMGNAGSTRRKGFKGKFKRSRDPLKTFSAEVKILSGSCATLYSPLLLFFACCLTRYSCVTNVNYSYGRFLVEMQCTSKWGNMQLSSFHSKTISKMTHLPLLNSLNTTAYGCLIVRSHISFAFVNRLEVIPLQV